MEEDLLRRTALSNVRIEQQGASQSMHDESVSMNDEFSKEVSNSSWTTLLPPKSFEVDEEESIVVDFDHKKAGLSLVVSNSSKDSRACEGESDESTLSSTESEDSHKSPAVDNVSSLDIDHDHKEEGLKPFQSNPRASETSDTVLLDDVSTESSTQTQLGRSLQQISSKTYFYYDTESEESEKPHEISNSTTMVEDDSKKDRLLEGRGSEISSIHDVENEEWDQSQNDQRFEEFLHEDVEREIFDPLVALPGSMGAHKLRSALDLIYGNGEAKSHFSNGPLCTSMEPRSPPRGNQHNHDFRIKKNPFEMEAAYIEAFFYNRGMEIAMGVLYLASNYLVAAHGAYQFTEAGGWTTDNDILRITVPIARAGGRLVTLNCAVLLLTSCKYLWTMVRTYIAPVIPIGFPIDDVMPKYHRYVALTIIVSGCIIHTLPQIVSYASKSISMDHDGMKSWTFGNGLASKQLLLTGTILAIIFSTFFLTTLEAFRKTAAGFRWFWFFHVGGIAMVYPLLLLHGTFKGRPIFFYVAFVPLLLYLFDLTMRRTKISTTDIIRWESHEHEGQEIIELVIECPPNFQYTPGQYAELRFPPISDREWHPFTIASAPNEKIRSKNGKKELVFYIKKAGRWTGALCDYFSYHDSSGTKQTPQIFIRGPHGSPAANYFEYKHILVIGSGIGVAPLLSIWKYLVAKGKAIAGIQDRRSWSTDSSSMQQSVIDVSQDFLLSERSPYVQEDDQDIVFGESLEFEAAKTNSTFRADCIFLQTIFESMTVSLSLFALFVLGETFTVVLQLFDCVSVANIIGFSLSVFALIVHGATIMVSTVAMGWSMYSKHFRCWIECSIVFVDSIALWFSIQTFLNGPQAQQKNMEMTIIYLTLFGYVVFLHAIRIFHIFYMTLKPVAAPKTDRIKMMDELAPLEYHSSDKEEICSVQGILINQKYSNMRFAVKDLLPPILEEDISDLFSMECYGTRETESEDVKHQLIRDMMGSRENLDIRSSIMYSKQKKNFCAGRPDWNRIFLKAISRAHCTNEEGESVGVFFCGSPAIAKDLQLEAKRVTARHQFAMKHAKGKACKCKLIVHCESF